MKPPISYTSVADKLSISNNGYALARLSAHHPLNLGLKHSFVFQGSKKNIQGFRLKDYAYNPIQLKWKEQGVETTDGFGPYIQHVNNLVSGNFTLRLIFRIDKISANEHVLIDKDGEFYVSFDSNGDINEVTIGGITSAVSIATGFVPNTLYELVFSRASDNHVDVFVNHDLVATFTNTGTSSFPMDYGIGISVTNNAVANLRGIVYIFEAWDRYFYNNRVLALAITPYYERLARYLPYERKLDEDTVTFGETVVALFDRFITVIDSVSYTENILPGADLYFVAKESFDTIVTINIVGDRYTIAEDTVKINERGGKAYAISVNDSFATAENSGPGPRPVDNLSLSDVAVAFVSQHVVDAILFSESGTVVYSRGITVTDSVTFIGGISGFALIDNQYSPSIGGTD